MMSDNEMMPGTVHRSPDIYLTAEEHPEKPQLGDRLMKGLCEQSLPQMRSVGSHSTSERDKEERMENITEIPSLSFYFPFFLPC